MTSTSSANAFYAQGNTKKYDIPISHLDYKYIETCTDVKELEKILKILRSGDEGCFPEMITQCEKRIAELDPNSRILRKENPLQNMSSLNRDERQAISEDLKNWTSEIKSTDTILPNNKDMTEFDDDSLPPVRSGKISLNGMDTQPTEKSRKNKSAKPRSYAEWDKFDIDKELEDADKTDTKVKKNAHQPEIDVTVDTTGMTDAERAMKATREKEKGNEAFRSGDYREAIAYYSRSIQLQSTAASFNNRALAYLKEKDWMKAETDCNKVLTLEPDNIKALLRRGTAYKGKKEFSKGLNDFQRVLELEPSNKRAEELISELQKEEKKYIKEKKEKGKRMVIEEVDGSSDDSSDEIVVDKKPDNAPSSNKSEEEKPHVNGFHDEPIQNENLNKSTETISNQKKDTKDIWDADEVPEQKRTNKEPKKGRIKKQTKTDEKNKTQKHAEETVERENVLKLQENVAVCENSNNINIENEMKSSGESAVQNDSESLKNKNLHNVQTMDDGKEVEQNLQNESKETLLNSDQEKSEETKGKGPEGNENSGEESKPIERPVLYQTVLPNDIAELREIGNGLFKTGQYGEAIQKYTQAIQKIEKRKEDHQVNLSLLYSNRAACNLKTGDIASAVSDCSKSLDLVPHAIKPLLRRGQAYETLERYGLAYADYKHVLSIDSTVDMALQGSTRCQSHLQQIHSMKWREKIPPVPFVLPWEVPEVKDASGKPINQSQTIKPATSSQSIPSSSYQSESKTVPISTSASSSSTKSSSSSSTSVSTSSPVLSDEEKYEKFKTEGNNFVKESDFRKAIESYGQCIDLLPDKAVGYTNRSLCYLRTNQPEKAENDCNKVLQIESDNVKALFRRAQAKKMLKRYKESLEDLTTLLKIDTKNAAAKKEMEVVKGYYRDELNSMKEQMTKSKEPAVKTPTSKPRKRMVIQEVDDEEEEESNQKAQHNKKNPPSKQTSPRNSSSTKVEVIKSSVKKKMEIEKLKSVKTDTDKGKTPEPAAQKKSSKKSESENKTTTPQNKLKSVPPKSQTIKATSVGLPTATPSVPKLQENASPFEFMQAWNALKTASDTKPYSDLLKQIPPNRLPEVISNKLDGPMLSKIMSCISSDFISSDKGLSFKILQNLSKVSRFQTISMFQSDKEKKEVRSVIEQLQSSASKFYSAAELSQLRKDYSIE